MDPPDQEEMELYIVNRSRDAFIARRTETAHKRKQMAKKGRELRWIPAEWRDEFEKSDKDEWEKWIRYDAVTVPTQEVLRTLDPSEVLPMRKLRTDKNEATRGGRSYQEHPLRAKTRNIVPGYKDKQFLSGELKTNAPTLTDAATAIILQETASNEN